jgi:hypothetical protein
VTRGEETTMASIMDLVRQHLGSGEMEQISNQIGASPSATQQAIDAALPMLVGGMAQKASTPAGEQDLHQAVDAHQGVLGSLGSLLGAAPMGDSGGLLGRILGHTQAPVQDGVAKASGLQPDQVKRLLTILAPIALGVLAHMREQQVQQSKSSVGDILKQEQQTAQQQAQARAPGLGGLLGQIFGAH